jgi:hypothetical protein
LENLKKSGIWTCGRSKRVRAFQKKGQVPHFTASSALPRRPQLSWWKNGNDFAVEFQRQDAFVLMGFCEVEGLHTTTPKKFAYIFYARSSKTGDGH